MTIHEAAPAKVNLVLHVGPRRADGLHEICSLFASLDLADELTVEESDEDEVICPGVPGSNLAAKALEAYRERAPLPPLRVTIVKRIPVAAGLGGGSADAAATLRAADAIAGHALGTDELRDIGRKLGADVPSQVEPRHALVTGAGESIEPVDLPDMALLLVPANRGLSTKDVYAEADRLPSTRAHLDPAPLRTAAGAPLAALAHVMENDLQAAALGLRPELTATLAAIEEAGAMKALISGSGPTAVGVFPSVADAVLGAAAPALPANDAIVTRLREGPRYVRRPDQPQ